MIMKRSMSWLSSLDPNFIEGCVTTIRIGFNIKTLVLKDAVGDSSSVTALAVNHVLPRFVKAFGILNKNLITCSNF